MMLRPFFTVFLFLFSSIIGWAQLTITITSVPSNTPTDAELYIAGNFQGWNPEDLDYQFSETSNGNYVLTIDPPAGILEYKITRGAWANVEGTNAGGFLPNRTYTYDGSSSTLDLTIAGWEDLSGSGNAGSTAASNVEILDDAYFLPQLNRTRRVWIYLPPDYTTSSKTYPVLYLHDGQNVFDAATSFAGEWEVDETLNRLFDDGDYGCIVVAIDNGGSTRIDEYCPWVNPNYGGGEGGAYVDFIVETLKPDIDARYRTQTDREHTAIGGSSLGGLISSYALAAHPAVFGKAMCMSPAYWINTDIYQFVAAAGEDGTTKKYLNAGTTEGNGSVVGDVNGMESALLNAGFDPIEINKVFHTDGAHAEWYWAREFGAAYQWLFDESTVSTTMLSPSNPIRIFPNPATGFLFIEPLGQLDAPVFELYSLTGTLLQREQITRPSVRLVDIPAGQYLVRLSANGKVVLTDKVWVE